MSLNKKELHKIFNNDTIMLVDQSPTDINGYGSTLYICNSEKVKKIELTNQIMQIHLMEKIKILKNYIG